MPYAEYRAWQLYYMVEPFGWHDNEYRTAIELTMQYNANKGKGKAKQVKDFYRDMPAEVLKQFTSDEPAELDGMTFEQRRAYIQAQIKKDFGIT